MRKSIRFAMAIAGCLSVLITSSALADERVQLIEDTSISGLSNITTTDQGNGGAVVNNGFNLTVTSGDFINNSLTSSIEAVSGGAIYQNGGTLNIADGITFDNNTVSAVNVLNGSSGVIDSPSGGAIFITNTTGNNVIGDVTFSNNIASAIKSATNSTESSGGAIYAQNNSSIKIGDASFSNNQSNTKGGAIYNGDSNISMGQVSFEHNTTHGDGGAIYSINSNTGVDTVTSTAANSSFTNNEATNNGGAIYNQDGQISIGNSSTFTENTAKNDGGAIYNVSVNDTATTTIGGGTNFSGNTATGNGGAIYNGGSVELNTTNGNITFSGNSAQAGKDLYLAENSTVNITGTNTVSIQSGEGAIAGSGAINNVAGGTFELVNSDISQSYTGLYTQQNGTLSLDNSTMSNNFNIGSGNLVLKNGSKLFLSENGKIASGTITLEESLGRALGDSNVLTLKNGGQIASVVDLVLNANNQVVIETGSEATLGGSGDLWAGTVTLQGGTLNYEGLATNGQLVAESGKLNINNGSLSLSGTDAQSSSIISEAVNVDIASGSTLAIGANGTATIDSGDNWAGTVSMTDGVLNYNGTTNGLLNATGGDLNILQNGVLTLQGSGQIADAVNVDIASGSTLAIGANGTATIDSGDNWAGTVSMTDGVLNYNGTTNGLLNATGGNLNILQNGVLTLQGGSLIANNTNSNVAGKIIVNNGGSITGGINNFDNGQLEIINGGIISGGENTFNNGSTLTIGNNGTLSGGTNNINSGGAIIVGNGGTISGGNINIANGANGTIQNGGTVSGGTVTVDGSYTNNGNIQAGSTTNVNNGGSFQNTGNISGGDVQIASGGEFQSNGTISGGNINIENGANGTIQNGGTVSGGTITVDGSFTNNGNIQGGTTNINAGSTFENKGEISNNAEINISSSNSTNSGIISGGTVNIQNNSTFTNSGTISGGTTNISNGSTLEVDSNGKITNGDINVDGTLTNNGTISGGNLDISGTVNNNSNINGNTNITIDSNGSIIVSNGGTIDTTGAIEIATGGSLTIKQDSSATIKADDIWDGEIVNENGTLTLVNRDDSGKNYTQTGGELVLNNSNFVLDGEINGGNVIVSNGSNFDIGTSGSMTDGDLIFEGTGNTVNISGNVEANAQYEINNSNTVNIKEDGNFIANNNDVWTDGTITVNGGTLDFQGTIDEIGNNANGQLVANTGNVFINSDLNLTSGSSIAQAVNVEINQNINVENGSSIAINTGDSWASDATITVNGGSLTFDDLTSNGHIAANSGIVDINSGTLTVDDESYINGAVNTTIGENATVNITGSADDKGSVTIDRNDNWEGTITVNGGSLNYSGTQNGNIQANSGDLTIGNDSILTMDDINDVIADAVNTTINGTLNIQNGSANLNDNDIWNGIVNLQGGTLNLDNVINGTLIAENGNLNFNNGELNITGNSIIKDDTVVNFANGIVNINSGNNGGGSVTLDSGDIWSPNVTVNLGQGGTLDYNLNSNGNLAANSGTLITQTGSQLTITGEESFIKSDVTADLKGNLIIGDKGVVDLGNDGQTTTGANDSLTGDVNIQNGGTLNLFNDVAMEEPIAGAVQQTITIDNGGVMNLETTGELHLSANLNGSGDINKNGEGDIWFHGQNGGYTGTILVDNGGDLLFENGLAGNLVFGDIDGKTIGIHADEITGNLDQNREATIKYTTYHDDRDLELTGNINVTKGTLIAESKGDNDIIFDGTVNVSAADDAELPVSMNATSNGAITFGQDVNVDKSTLNIASVLGTTFDQNVTLTNSILNATSGNLYFNQLTFNDPNSVINTMNGTINNNTIENLDLYQGGQANFKIDVSTRVWDSDKYTISNIKDLDGCTLNISDWQFIGKAPIDRHIQIDVFDVNNIDPTLVGNIQFTQTDKQIFTPIGWYQLFNQSRYNPITGGYDNIPGSLQASLVRYNPQVFRGQVSTVASYANQLVTNNILFDHIFTVSNQLLSEQNPNKYAAAYPQFAPYQYSRKDGSLWYKAYGTLERLNMNQGLRVDNTAYGALVGADFPVIEMKKGWSFLPTAYVGYNGAHQSFDGVGMYQNGGQIGAMGTFMKDDFIGSVLAYAGGYGNQMDVAGYHDHTGNWFAGAATKAAYNFHPTKHFTIQPTLLASYNYFHSQDWYTGFGDMNMNAGRLNGVNVAPGLNLIYGRETWSLYATIQYMFNILGTSSGNAGNVVLPDVRMKRSYIEYGIGATKTWKDRFSAYLQITVRNIGRTGIGFQGGFSFKL